MSQDNVIKITSKESKETRYTKKPKKSKKGIVRKLELKKYSPKLRKHVVFKESKK
jgi:large subunit ribosomal protein L33